MPPNVALTALAASKPQEQERELFGSKWKETGYVFTTRTGGPLDQKHLFNEFRAILAAAELPTVRIHDLRHSAATLLIAQEVHARFNLELLGHSTITLTMNTYGHLIDAMKRQNASQMDAIQNPMPVKRERKPLN